MRQDWKASAYSQIRPELHPKQPISAWKLSEVNHTLKKTKTIIFVTENNHNIPSLSEYL